MRRLPRATYALFVAMLPATAVIIGIIVLHQIPVAAESVRVALVILGVLIHKASGASRTKPQPSSV